MAFITGEEITDLAIERWSTARSPRLATVMTALIGHVHDFAREVHLTEDEWLTGIEWLETAGKFNTDGRREYLMFSEVLGLSTLVLELNNRYAAQTPATPLGPYIVHDAPEVPFGFDMSRGLPGVPLYITGKLIDVEGIPIPDAILTAWQADTEGHYHQSHLRGKYRTRGDGSYCIRTISPIGYSMPTDGPVGDLLRHADVSPFRPAHIHFLIDEAGYETLNTELFPAGTQYLDTDAGLASKGALAVPFVERRPGPTPDGGSIETSYLHADYDFVVLKR
jgi:hydroxyquinol 1,2-dioxygenase